MPSAGPLPDLFVVGDAKCGTTSLHRLFELAPGVGTARTRKELHYFSAPELVRAVSGARGRRDPGGDRAGRGGLSRRVRASHPGLPAIADVSPSYLRVAAAAERLPAFAPEARIVILVREPAAKVFSQYVHLWSAGRETLPFEAAFARARSGGRRASRTCSTTRAAATTPRRWRAISSASGPSGCWCCSSRS